MLLSELANTSGAIYGIDPNRDAFLKLRGTVFSGFIITNDLTPESIATNWDQTKALYMKNANFNYKESTIDSGYTVIHGLGAQHDTLDHDQTDANALVNLSAKSHAIPFYPSRDNVSKLTPFLSKLGNDNERMSIIVSIVGSNEDGSPNPEDIRQTVTVPGNRLTNELDVASYFDIPIDRETVRVSHGEKLFMLFPRYEDQARAVRLDYQTGRGRFYDSIDGIVWIERIGDMKFRTYNSRTIHIIGQNTVARKNLRAKEKIFSLVDFQNEQSALIAFEGALDVSSKVRRLYDPVIAATPGSRPTIGSTAKLLDVFNGLDTTVDIIGYDIEGSAFEADSNLGAKTMTVLVEEYL